MNVSLSINDFPPDVAAQIGRFLFDRAQPLLVEFDPAWQLIGLHGDAARFGFDAENAEAAAAQLQELFIGMPLDESFELLFVEMPNGRSAHVHLLAGAGGHQVLLIDAAGEHQRQQAQQQLGNEAVLIGQQKAKAITQLRQIRSELEQQRARLQEADALKDALIATLSHDFRTPLTSIFGYLHLLEGERSLGADARNWLRVLRRNANYLFALAENLLEYARTDRRSSLLAPVHTDLAALLDDLVALFRPLAEEQGVQFIVGLDVDAQAEVILDALRLRQVLVNLLANAVRFTREGSITTQLAWKDGALHAEVRDTGIGIAEDMREKVFQPFHRSHRSSSGAGLGLSIVRRLVRQMHGTLDMQSSVGKGTRFSIVLPGLEAAIAPTESSPAPQPAPEAAADRIRTVLIVDDDPDICQLLEMLLTDLGFRTRTLADATAAVESALADPPDILLVDVELPGLSGNTAVFRLRAKGYRGHIVTISATPTEEARQVALNAGANQYITKPLDIEQFARVMQRI